LEFDWRHVGTGLDWSCATAGSNNVLTNLIGTKAVGDVTFTSELVEFTFATASTRYLIFKENNATNNGGVYMDNFSAKKKG